MLGPSRSKALATTLLAGTAAGAVLLGHLFVAGTVITLAWLAATWHGIRLLRAARADADADAKRTGSWGGTRRRCYTPHP